MVAPFSPPQHGFLLLETPNAVLLFTDSKRNMSNDDMILFSYSECCIVGNWLCFIVFEDVSPLIQEASSVLTNWRGAAGF